MRVRNPFRANARRNTLLVVVLAVTLSAAIAACQSIAGLPTGFSVVIGSPAAQQAAPPVKALEPAKATERLPQPLIAAPIPARAPTRVPVTIEAKEITATIDEGVSFQFWTFGGTVPGPLVRVRKGDTVDLTFKNAADNKANHSIDLHAVTGPGGGAKATDVKPGQEAKFSFKALNPGVYVYHCATAPVPYHITNGMYGLIVVEPEGGLSKVDREYYVMQGDLYIDGKTGEKGHHATNFGKLTDERADYVLFNGSVGALTGERALRSNVGETVRIFFGVGGPNLVSSFHIIGEIFDRVHHEGASEVQTNVQTTLVPPGGATMVELKTEYPGNYILVDHALGRLTKGASGILTVEGPADPAIFSADRMTDAPGH